ncbi:ATP-grasp fold amidoligase family protein [Serratia nevei]|nr:ATP-grasp fold amidoligase family protein [Serratia nevei]WMC78072.1 ATP-grasp fold amidoligase family protein [Serratia nevei]WMC83506.1 ATP-grasp fold amidoligase family protein [Serratia nevei]
MLDIKYKYLSDKLLVRDYVRERIGDDYFVPLLYHTTSPDTLLNCSPQCDVMLKPNHGAGMFRVVRAADYDVEKKEIVSLCKKWLQIDFSQVQREIQYKNIARQILVEKLLGNGLIAPTDYKFHMFRNREGGFKFVLQIINERFTGVLSRTFYVNGFDKPFDMYDGDTKNSTISTFCHVDKPLAAKALRLSCLLAIDFDYVRVDWYIHDGELFFSELTFTPAAGFGVGYGAKLDKLMGDFWI